MRAMALRWLPVTLAAVAITSCADSRTHREPVEPGDGGNPSGVGGDSGGISERCAPERCPEFSRAGARLPGCCVNATVCGLLPVNPDPTQFLGYPEGCVESRDDYQTDLSCPSRYVCGPPGSGDWLELALALGCRRRDGSCGMTFNGPWAWTGCISGFSFSPVPEGVCIDHYKETTCDGSGCPPAPPP